MENGWVAGQGQLQWGGGHSSGTATCSDSAGSLVQLRSLHYCVGHFSWGYILPSNSPQQTLVSPSLGARNCAGCWQEKGLLGAWVYVCAQYTQVRTPKTASSEGI